MQLAPLLGVGPVTCFQEALLVMVATFLTFVLIGQVVTVVSRLVFSGYGKLPVRKQQSWNNIATSLVHSVIVGPLALYTFVDDLDMVHDVLFHDSAMARFTLAVSTGYFWYDTADMAIHRMYLNQPVVWLHHLVVVVPFSLALWDCQYAPILVAGLLVEFNTCLQHARRLFTIFDDKSSFGFIITIVSLYATFIPMRIVPHMWVVWCVVKQWADFNVGWHAWVALTGSVGITVVDVGVLVVVLGSDWSSLRDFVIGPDEVTARRVKKGN